MLCSFDKLSRDPNMPNLDVVRKIGSVASCAPVRSLLWRSTSGRPATQAHHSAHDREKRKRFCWLDEDFHPCPLYPLLEADCCHIRLRHVRRPYFYRRERASNPLLINSSTVKVYSRHLRRSNLLPRTCSQNFCASNKVNPLSAAFVASRDINA